MTPDMQNLTSGQSIEFYKSDENSEHVKLNKQLSMQDRLANRDFAQDIVFKSMADKEHDKRSDENVPKKEKEKEKKEKKRDKSKKKHKHKKKHKKRHRYLDDELHIENTD